MAAMAATAPDRSYGEMHFVFNASFEEWAKEQTASEVCFEHALRVKETIINEMIPKLVLVRHDSKLLVAIASLIFALFMLALCFTCSPSSKNKNRKSNDVDDNKLVGSVIPPARERLSTDDSYSRTSAKAGKSVAVAICGHKAASIRYETWTPPTPWTDASKQLLPTHARMKAQVAQVQIELNLARGILNVEDSDTSFDLHKVQLHVQRTTGAVIDLFVGGNKLEHTFQSAQSAAQFQHDLLAYQIVGKVLMNMYHSLELVHRGSEAHEGKESVLHDSVGDSETIVAAIAWDDVFRCLGGASSDLRAALEQHPLREWEELELESLSSQYQSRRAMLGPVDFFRLFCPLLPPGSEPKNSSSPSRLKVFVDLRKQVALASLYTQAYVRGRCVANKGWHLDGGKGAKRRLAYDDNVENINHDAMAKNEFYEGIISRDVVCDTHSKWHPKSSGNSTTTSVQAYALVGFHTFRLPPVGVTHSLAHDRDPVEAIPSLSQIVRSNPNLDFFCVALFPEGGRIALIKLFVRTLPKGVDPSFDMLLERFTLAGEEGRESKLALILHLGPGGGLSPLVWAGIKVASTILSWTRGGDQCFPVEGRGERARFPGMLMDYFVQLNHFGGCLQSNSAVPANYVATTANFDAKRMGNMLFRFLYNRVERALPAIVVDFSYALEGNTDHELSQKVLGTVRMVHVDPEETAHSVEMSSNETRMQATPAVSRANSTIVPKQEEMKADTQPYTIAERSCRALSDDCGPFQTGIDDLIDILHGVLVPVRRTSLLDYQIHLATVLTPSQVAQLPPQIHPEDFVNLPALEKLDRSDLRRYYVACECDLKEAAVRIVKSTAWREITFPVDTRTCRIELQSGQFFQQGKDLKRNPVFYFRNMCVGPWRKDSDAVIQAVLHRLETRLQVLKRKKADVKITLVVLLGRSLVVKKKKKKNHRKIKSEKNDDETKVTADNTEEGNAPGEDEGTDDVNDTEAFGDENEFGNPYRAGVNPRLPRSEDYHVHTNQALIKTLIHILLEHYPERLHKAIFVPGKSRGYGYWKTALGVQLAIRSSVVSVRTRTKCFILHRACELKEFVHPSEIVTIAGGEAPIQEGVFECV
jgi:hypothetical protein